MEFPAVSKLQAVGAVVGLVVASVGGAFALGIIGAPAVVAVENRFGPVTNQTTVIETDLVVNNPNPIGITLGETTINYTVNMNDVAMAHGSKTGLHIGTGNTTLNFTTRMNNGKIPDWWVTHVRNGERTTVTINATIETSILGNRTFDIAQKQQVETDIIGAFASKETRPVNGPPSPLYSNPILYVNRTDASWGTVTQAETPIRTEFVIFNPHLKPYVITEVGYEITMNGVLVGEGATDRTYVIPGGATETLRTRTAIQNRNLDEWWVTHLQNGQVTELKIDFYAKIELPTGQEIRVPLQKLTYTTTIETDIFGTKNESGDENASGTDTDRATPTPTPTDDGLVGGTTDSPLGTPTTGPLTGDGSPLDTATDGTTGGTTATDGGDATATPDGSTETAPGGTETGDGGLLASLVGVAVMSRGATGEVEA